MKWKLVYVKDVNEVGPISPFVGEELTERPKKHYKSFGEAQEYITSNALDGKVVPRVAGSYNVRSFTRFEAFVSLCVFGIFLAAIVGLLLFIYMM